MLSNFLFDICGLEPTWTMDNIIEQKVAEIRQKVGNGRVILALSVALTLPLLRLLSTVPSATS